MENEFVPYEEALALKELGFDELVLGFRFENNELHLTETECNSIEFSDVTKINDRVAIEAPLYQQAFRWFREEHNIQNKVQTNGTISELKYIFILTGAFGFEQSFNYTTYEEAELACLKKLIEIVKEKL